MNEKLTRCFIALDLPCNVINEIANVQERIKKKKLFDGNLVENDNLHLTLKFLGEIDSGKIEEVEEKLKDIKFSDFEVRLGEIGVFSEKFVRIVWIKLDGKGVFELQKKIDEKLKDLFEPEKRFMSHITLARVKRVYDKNGFLEYLNKINVPKMSFNIDKFYLKKSELSETGSIYEDLEIYDLGKEKI